MSTYRKVAMLAQGACLALLPTGLLAQGEASRYVYIPPDAQEIIESKDYFSLSLVQGWYSSRHNFLQNLLSQDTKASVLLQSTMATFDGEVIEKAETFSNTDVKRNVDRSWGLNPTLFDRLPGNLNPSLNVQIAIYRQDNLSSVLGALDDSKQFLPPDVIASPVIGYARAITGVFRNVFGTDRTRYPFIWQGNLRSAATAMTSRGMKEHYIILIAPRARNDALYGALDASKLSFDLGAQRLKYNANLVTDWSYAVFHVRKVTPYNILQLVNGSNAPWAVMARSYFIALPTSDFRNKEELGALERSVLTQLSNMTDLLGRERRFSSFSRTEALVTFSKRARDQIRQRCTQLQIADADCPINQLNNYVSNAESTFSSGIALELQQTTDQNVAQLRMWDSKGVVSTIGSGSALSRTAASRN